MPETVGDAETGLISVVNADFREEVVCAGKCSGVPFGTPIRFVSGPGVHGLVTGLHPRLPFRAPSGIRRWLALCFMVLARWHRVHHADLRRRRGHGGSLLRRLSFPERGAGLVPQGYAARAVSAGLT